MIMEFIPLALGGLKAVGAVVGGLQESANSKTRENIYKINARYAAQDAVTELQTANLESNRVRREARETIAEQFAGFAQSGFGVNDFSTTLALEESGANAEIDALNVIYRGEIASRSRQIEAQNQEYQARIEKSGRKSLPFTTALKATTALLGGAASYQGAKIA